MSSVHYEQQIEQFEKKFQELNIKIKQYEKKLFVIKEFSKLSLKNNQEENGCHKTIYCIDIINYMLYVNVPRTVSEAGICFEEPCNWTVISRDIINHGDMVFYMDNVNVLEFYESFFIFFTPLDVGQAMMTVLEMSRHTFVPRR
ncbi:hypothetical protein JTB14_012188 [Gonioctena quinquepunctata]|nr:hypothetical protein JTB14_012188 [Gonioctena quinquepunctata]